jgi:predicted PurR-regulated permease PerM
MRDYLPQLSAGARRWVRFGALIIALILVIWLGHLLQSVLTLLAISFAIAYICSPLITALERRGLRRLIAVSAFFSIAFIVLASGGVLLVTAAYLQLDTLVRALPGYVTATNQWLAQHYPDVLREGAAAATQPATYQDVWPTLSDYFRDHAGSAVSWGRRFFAGAGALLSALVLIPMFSFFFLLHYDELLRTIRDHLPAAYRDTIVSTVRLIDEKTAEFFRGRIVVCAIVGILTGIGWLIVGAPYSLPFALLVGVLNLVPFLSIIALPPVLVLTCVHNLQAGTNWLWPVTLVLIVYMGVQAIESFILHPYFSARSSGLHPVTTIVALLVGGQLAGLLGMLLSIPAASTLKSLGTLYVLPELKRLARGDDEPPAPAAPDATGDQP